jgi:hypothetical protein
MKKISIALLGILFIFSLLTYILIPSTISIDSISSVKTTDNGTERFLLDESKWNNWWQYGKSDSANTGSTNNKDFSLHGYHFQLSEKYYKSASILISKDTEKIASKLFIVRLALDSTGIDWKCTIQTGLNPFVRIARYQEAKKLKSCMEEVMSHLGQFLSKVENVYGLAIERNYLKDTLYVTAKKMVNEYPSTASIYALIKSIQQYASKNEAPQTGYPIFNVTDFGNNHFQLMAGVPVSKNIPEKDGFALKHMVKGSFMISEVVGDNKAVDEASKKFQLYFSDFNRTSMAMNFSMLVTDRLLQPDSTKWITKLYRPVF